MFHCLLVNYVCLVRRPCVWEYTGVMLLLWNGEHVWITWQWEDPKFTATGRALPPEKRCRLVLPANSKLDMGVSSDLYPRVGSVVDKQNLQLSTDPRVEHTGTSSSVENVPLTFLNRETSSLGQAGLYWTLTVLKSWIRDSTELLAWMS